MEAPIPDERPQRRREYSGAGSTLGVAALLVLVLGAAIWWLELRGHDGGSLAGEEGTGIVALAEGANPTGRAPAAESGRAAPDFRLRTPTGGEHTLSDFRGAYVLINFWASWCGPCRGEAPDLEQLHRDAGGRLIVLGVNQQETDDDARAFVREFGLTYPVVMDRSGEVSQAYRVGRGLPISFLVAPDGVIERVIIGRVTAEDVRGLLALAREVEG